MNKTALLQQKYIINTYAFRGKVFVKGQGNYLIDDTGKKYLDLITNYGVNIFGYGQKEITQSLLEQSQRLINLHGSFANDVRTEAARILVNRVGTNYKVYFANSGTEAIEAAIKFAVVATRKSELIAATNSYHGKTLGSLAITGQIKYRENLEHILPKVRFAKFGNIKSFEKNITNKTAAVIIEPIQGEGGVNIPEADFIKNLSELCRKRNVLLIIDEIQTGMGRTGTFLAIEDSEIEPDMICLGKGLAGGIPVGATLVNEKIANSIKKGFQTSTFGGNPLACAGIIATLNLLDQPILKSVKTKGEYFLAELAKISGGNLANPRGKGLMLAIDVKGNRNDWLKQIQNQGILACPAGELSLRFLPTYLITETEIKRVCEELQKINYSITNSNV